MHTFKDTTGRDWQVDLTLEKIMVIEGYDFSIALKKNEPTYLSFYPPQSDLFDLFENPRVIFSMLWCAVYDQAKTSGINDELEFAKLFDGNCLRAATMAVYKELPNFFCEMRTTLQALIERHSRIQEIADRKMGGFVNRKASEQDLEKLVDEEISRLENNLPVSLGGTSLSSLR